MSAEQATRAALAALTTAPSVHVRGTFSADGRSEQFDMRFEGTGASGSFTLKGTPIRTITCGGSMYLNAGPDGWAAMGNSRDAAGMMAGRWVKVSPATTSGDTLTFGFFTGELAAHATAPQGTAAPGTLDGRQVVIVTYRDGSRLYIAATGAAYPLRFDVTGSTGGQRDFSEYGAPFHIAAPGNATDISQ
jgi:hypothetical protein